MFETALTLELDWGFVNSVNIGERTIYRRYVTVQSSAIFVSILGLIHRTFSGVYPLFEN